MVAIHKSGKAASPLDELRAAVPIVDQAIIAVQRSGHAGLIRLLCFGILCFHLGRSYERPVPTTESLLLQASASDDSEATTTSVRRLKPNKVSTASSTSTARGRTKKEDVDVALMKRVLLHNPPIDPSKGDL